MNVLLFLSKLVLFLAVVLLPACTQTAEKQDPGQFASKKLIEINVEENPGVRLIANEKIAATLKTGNGVARIAGRTSIYLVAETEALGLGLVSVEGFNLVFFGVPQRLLAGDVKVDNELGVLGFRIATDRAQVLRYDPKSMELYGEVDLIADAGFLNMFALPQSDQKNDLFLTPTWRATATLRIKLENRLDSREVEPQKIITQMEVAVRVEELRYEKYVFRGFELESIRLPDFAFEIGPIRLFQVSQMLCIQPVRILQFTIVLEGWDLEYLLQLSGAGLAFGEPGLKKEWGKADVIFNIRDWKTVFFGNFWELDSGETGALRATVDDDDCIEVFFVNDFDPDSMWGGGATWGSGTAGSKVISSDGNARGGVDFTHLAHEVGHVIGLRHPDAAATATSQPASTGTLMCPSGYLNDNPQVNSQENEDLIQNPLLTFVFTWWRVGPDCQNSADCGACP